MTRDEFTDIIARMTPKQRLAMAVFGEACYEAGVTGDGRSSIDIDYELDFTDNDKYAYTDLLNEVYPGAIGEPSR